jgi:hypothetical protein
MDFLMEPKQRLEILKNAPPNTWLAFSEDESRVIGMAATYAEAVELAAKEGVDDPVLLKTPDEWLTPVF